MYRKIVNQFTDRYKKLSNAELVKIIDTPEDYQPEAVEAANNELVARTISAEELSVVRAEHEAATAAKRSKQVSSKDVVTAISYTLTEKSPACRIIVAMTALMVLLSLYLFVFQYGFFVMLFDEPVQGINFKATIYLTGRIILPLGTILFAFRKKSGWVLLSGFLSYIVINSCLLLYLNIELLIKRELISGRSIFMIPSFSSFGGLMFAGGCMYFIYKNELRAIYDVTKSRVIISVAIGIVLTVIDRVII